MQNQRPVRLCLHEFVYLAKQRYQTISNENLAMCSLSGNSGSALQQLAATKIFRRYLERKIEADTLEEEARRKNVSLNEIEEERNKGGA